MLVIKPAKTGVPLQLTLAEIFRGMLGWLLHLLHYPSIQTGAEGPPRKACSLYSSGDSVPIQYQITVGTQDPDKFPVSTFPDPIPQMPSYFLLGFCGSAVQVTFHISGKPTAVYYCHSLTLFPVLHQGLIISPVIPQSAIPESSTRMHFPEQCLAQSTSSLTHQSK